MTVVIRRHPQRGTGMRVFEGASFQKGHGLGSIVKGLFRMAIPLASKIFNKNTLKTIGKHALKRGLDIASSEMKKAKRPRIVREIGHMIPTQFKLEKAASSPRPKTTKKTRRPQTGQTKRIVKKKTRALSKTYSDIFNNRK